MDYFLGSVNGKLLIYIVRVLKCAVFVVRVLWARVLGNICKAPIRFIHLFEQLG